MNFLPPFSDLTSQILSEAERLNWWRLSRTENIGPITFFRLLERYGSAGKALEALPDLARQGGRKTPFVAFDRARAEQEIEALTKLGAAIIAACEPGYSSMLYEIDDAPPLLTVRGNIDLLKRPCVGMVGARNASLSGRKMAIMMARDLGRAGYAVASGLARGIDSAAHEGAITSGTIAVVAGGVDNIYPPENAGLYAQILDQGGAIVSEQPAGLEPMAAHFPRRNRIIAGLSQGVVVVEATLKSGSLITARMAADQGRDVLAVPGSPLDPRAAGPNALIRDGAILVENAEHIISVLGAHGPRQKLSESAHSSYTSDLVLVAENEVAAARVYICEILSPTPVLVDELVRACQWSSAVVQTALLQLELAGHIERRPGNRIALIFKEENSEWQRSRHC